MYTTVSTMAKYMLGPLQLTNNPKMVKEMDII